MKKFFLLLSLIIILSGCVNTANFTTYLNSNDILTNTEKLPTSTVGLIPSVSGFPILYAHNNNMFKEKGFYFDLVMYNSSDERDEAYLNNELIGLSTDLIAIASYYADGIPTTTIMSTKETLGLVSSTFSTKSDFKNSDILYSKNTVIDYTLDQFLENYQLENSYINKIDVPSILKRLQLLNYNHPTSAVLPEPFLSMAIKDGHKLIITSDDINSSIVSFSFRKDFVDSNSKEVDIFLDVYDEAITILNNMTDAQFEDAFFESYNLDDSLRGHIDRFVFQESSSLNIVQGINAMQWAIDADIIDDFPPLDSIVYISKN